MTIISCRTILCTLDYIFHIKILQQFIHTHTHPLIADYLHPTHKTRWILANCIRPYSIIIANCKPGRKPGRKQVKSQLRTCLKRVFFYIPFVWHAHEPAKLLRFATRFSTKKVASWSKACRKHARTCRKPGCKPGHKPGLQLARIMECGLQCSTYSDLGSVTVRYCFVSRQYFDCLGLDDHSLALGLGLTVLGLSSLETKTVRDI